MQLLTEEPRRAARSTGQKWREFKQVNKPLTALAYQTPDFRYRCYSLILSFNSLTINIGHCGQRNRYYFDIYSI